MKTNTVAVNKERTYEGGHARTPKAAHQLERQVATCLLFENTFYAKGSTIAAEIAQTCRSVRPAEIAALAIKARNDFKLRHVPLFLLAQLDKRRGDKEAAGLLRKTIPQVVQRPDEMGELLSIIRKENENLPLKRVLTAQVKRGLANVFGMFSAHQLAKWNQDSEIKLRDVLFLVHAKPKDSEQAEVWKKLVSGTLEAPDTWEVALSSGADKKETWERLLADEKLGYIALLMNLRNMEEVKVDRKLVEKALIDGAPNSRALPFRFVSAFKHAPAYAQALSDAMLAAIEKQPLAGTTYLLIDVSGSMDMPLSKKGTLNRWEAGAALGILLREICESVRVFTFSNGLAEVSNLRGLGMLDGVNRSQVHSGTCLAESMKNLFAKFAAPDRLIVITDEQTHDGIRALPKETKGYLINVASYAPALELTNRWTRISGFSERLVDFIRWEETNSVL